MAKTKSPLFSLYAWGSIGKKITYVGGKRAGVVRMHKKKHKDKDNNGSQWRARYLGLVATHLHDPSHNHRFEYTTTTIDSRGCRQDDQLETGLNFLETVRRWRDAGQLRDLRDGETLEQYVIRLTGYKTGADTIKRNQTNNYQGRLKITLSLGPVDNNSTRPPGPPDYCQGGF